MSARISQTSDMRKAIRRRYWYAWAVGSSRVWAAWLRLAAKARRILSRRRSASRPSTTTARCGASSRCMCSLPLHWIG